MSQIEEKGYARENADDGRPVHKIGILFSTATHCLEDWKIASRCR